MENILSAPEAELLVDSLKVYALRDIGNAASVSLA